MLTKPRDVFFDNLKGVLIFAVVFAHYLLTYVDNSITTYLSQTVLYVLYSFHMPLFVFVSGYFSKDILKSRTEAFHKLFVPYLYFNTLMLLFTSSGLFFEGLFSPVYIHWYLLALFVWRVLLVDLVRIRYILPISVVLALLVGFVPGATNFLAMSRIFAFMPAFLLGYYARDSAIDDIKSIRSPLIIITTFVALLGVCEFSKRGALSIQLFTADPYVDPSAILSRMLFFSCALIFGLFTIWLTPRKKLPLITNWGRNSIVIFLFHRYFTFGYEVFIKNSAWSNWHFGLLIPVSALTSWLLTQSFVLMLYHRFLEALKLVLLLDETVSVKSQGFVRSAIIVCLPLAASSLFYSGAKPLLKSAVMPIIPPMSSELEKKLEQSVVVTFAGDMLLLEDQVKRGMDPKNGHYDYSEIFKATQGYLKKSDLVIADLEMPVAGSECGYSESNFDDNIALSLNAPIEFAQAIKDSGIGLVTTANNHAFDKGVACLRKTLDVLQAVGISHTGTYRDRAERSLPFIREVNGLKLGFIAYTSYINNQDERRLIAEDVPHIKLLASPADSVNLPGSLAMLREDVRKQREAGSDFIFAVPHMGTQFSHESDPYSDYWVKQMFELGVDVIFASSSHAVQPMEWRTIRGANGETKKGFVVFSPGNFFNAYHPFDGDAGALVNLYIANGSSGPKELIAASIVPLWTRCRMKGLCVPFPVYDLLTHRELADSLSELDFGRVKQAQTLVTEVMLGKALSHEQAQSHYYFLPDGSVQRKKLDLHINDEFKKDSLTPERAVLFELLAHARKTVFLGDSITAGSNNGGYGWFEPWQGIFRENTFVGAGKAGATSKTVLENLPNILALHRDADLWVIAIGVNDVRYRDKRIGAIDEREFTDNLSQITQLITMANPQAKTVFVSLWPAYRLDQNSKLPEPSRDLLIETFNKALGDFCTSHDALFIDAYKIIKDFLSVRVYSDYLVDHIHPNGLQGVLLYSNAVLFGDQNSYYIKEQRP